MSASNKATPRLAARGTLLARILEQEAWTAKVCGTAPPPDCSDAIVAAPARGAMAPFRPLETVTTANGPRVRYAPTPAGRPARRVHILEVMEARSRARRKAGEPPLFTNAQIDAAALYAELYERVASAGVKLSSLEGGGGGGGGFAMDAIIADSQRLRRMRSRVGCNLVLTGRGAAAHADRGRRSIQRMAMVDAVVVGEQSLDQVLARAGWSRQTRYRNALQDALREALTAIYGF